MDVRDDFSDSFRLTLQPLQRPLAALARLATAVARTAMAAIFCLEVTNGLMAAPALSVSPLKLAFGYSNGTPPGPQSLSLMNTGDGILGWTAAADRPWITVSPASGSGSAVLQVSVNPAGLAPSSYTGHITITASGATGSPQSVYVTLSVPSPQLTFSAKEVTVSIPSTGTASATFGLTNSGGGQLAWTAASQNTWLQVSPPSGGAPAQLQLLANLTGYAPGTYRGNVVVRAPGANGSPAILAFTALVGSSSGATSSSGSTSSSGGATVASLNVSPMGLNFSMISGGAFPNPQNLSVSSSSSTAASWSALANQSWIVLSASSAAIPSQLSVTANPAGMTAGTYQGAIQIAAAGLSGSPVSIPITLAITAPPTASGDSGGATSPTAEGNFYVSPTGSRLGTGSLTDPWDLATALSQPAAVKAGATIWLRGGIYHGGFTSKLVGAIGKPIIVRQYPGEHAVIDTGSNTNSAGIAAYGSDTWFWGFEIMSSNPVRTTGTSGSFAAPGRVDGVDSYGPRNKFINLIVHDTAQGFGMWSTAPDNEVYGCLIYYNGWQGPDRGHGHGIYTQNLNGIKLFQDDIQFTNFGMGFHAYGSETAYVKNVHVIGNVSFNNGYLSGGPSGHWANYLVTVGSGSEGIIFDDNHSYHNTNEASGQGALLGWSFSGIEKDLLARNNYLIGGSSAAEIWNWNKLTFTGNTMYSKTQFMTIFSRRSDQSLSNYTYDHNAYFGSGLLRYATTNVPWSSWLRVTGVDTTSSYAPGRPTGVWTFVRPNRYEPGRANIIIYNWDLSNYVSVDASGVLTSGQHYEVRDAQNFFAPPVTSGTYNGLPIAIPMNGLSVAPAVGNVPYPPSHTGPEFGTYVLLGN